MNINDQYRLTIIATELLGKELVSQISALITTIHPTIDLRMVMVHGGVACVLSHQLETSVMAQVDHLLQQYSASVDYAWQAPHPLPQVAIFDMDSTLIQCECIDELATAHGVGQQIADITAAAMRGELDFRASLDRRLQALQGLPYQAMLDLINRLPITAGLSTLCQQLQLLGVRMVIASGGFTEVANHLAERFGFAHVAANRLEWDEHHCLTGQVIDDIVDADAKASVLQQQVALVACDPQATLAVGDGANDLAMIGAAGLGVAFHAKPIVASQAPLAVSQAPIDATLAYCGLVSR